MIWPIYVVYVLVVGLIRIYKWIEFQFLKPFKPLLKRQIRQMAEKIGVVMHCPGDPKWGQADNERVLSSCKLYDKLIHVNIHDDMFFVRIANVGSMGSGESYLDKFWDGAGENPLEDISELTKRVLENDLLKWYFNWWNRLLMWLELFAFNLGTRKRAFQVGMEHYNIGNELFELMLDPWMQYTCGYWKDADNLNDAQLNKMELIAKKLNLKPGMRVLDIGCGWGTLCKYLAEKYGVECVGVTISEEGVAYGKKLCEGLPVEIRLQDYRDVSEKFDRIVSVGMFEHVGFWNYREYFENARRCLTDDGIFLCHTIGRNHFNVPLRSDPFSHKYIFPNGNLPSPEDIVMGTKGLFVIEDWHNFGPDYAKTLSAWRERFIGGWPQIEGKFNERFFRMWTFYLSVARGIFTSRRGQLWQVVLSKDGLRGDYRAAR